ncbi:hypothetical protein K1T73_09315 [Roseovarius sp. SCSIO 43702]|uniref:hypothetical protein n=1 Tax=Roseovarius sp. SCSIO 43702 TaxID=2823043 RepID=UPI001C73576D|nr:hypothetical protein [Roseovarius sp. SCSIO 43702]QYX55315.1 hypothetical protein K1T73_09315 [Roseovarius sp. SCSIO 43702]
MKKHLMYLTFAVGLGATSAHAGNLSAPVMEKQVIVQDATDNSDHDTQMVLAIVTLGLLITLGIAN